MYQIIEIDSPKYLKRLAKILNWHEHVYHRTEGRIIAGRWRVLEGRLMVHTTDWRGVRAVDPALLYDGHGRDIVASRE